MPGSQREIQHISRAKLVGLEGASLTSPSSSSATVKVSDAEKKWFSKCTELERDLQDQIGDDDKTGQMLEALDKSKNMDNSDIFMEQMRQLLGGQYHMCRPDLLALWGYKTELLKKKYRMA